MDPFDEDDGLPDDAFTEDELAAGVQHLLRGDIRNISKDTGTRSITVQKNGANVLAKRDAPLFDGLRNWRSEKAREQGVPAYMILFDRTLYTLAEYKPQSQAALHFVSGLGWTKADLYGEALLAVIASFSKISPIQRKKAEEDAPLFAALFNWTYGKFHNGSVLSYSILNRIEVLDLVEQKPQSQAELLQVIGSRKVSLYGKELLALLTPLYPVSRSPLGGQELFLEQERNE